MLFCFVGDCHGDIKSVYDYLLSWQERTNLKIDAVLQVGDFGIYHYNHKIYTDFRQYWNKKWTVPIPTWVIAGNHEGWSELEAWAKEPECMENLRLLPDGEITEVLGKKIGAIWGNYSPKSYANPLVIEQVRKYCPTSLKAMHIYKPSVERLMGLGAFDILMTHEAPQVAMEGRKQPPDSIKQELGLDGDEMCYGAEVFHRLWETGKPTHHVYGHMHHFRVIDGDPKIVQLGCWNYHKDSALYFLEI